MTQIADNVGTSVARQGSSSLELCVFRTMMAVVALSSLAALIVAPWRVTTGIIVGGGLSILNYHWLRTAMVAVFTVTAPASKPRIGIVRYLLRYFVIALVVSLAYKLRLISLPATIIGLCSFVPAFFFEALRQTYLVIIHREESF